MKKRLALLLAVLMLAASMPVMAMAAPTTGAEQVSVQAKSGWVKSNSRWMYYVNGRALKDTAKKIGTYYYGFDKNGYLCTGFFTLHGRTYYGSTRVGIKKCGAILRGYYHIGDGYYYFNPAKYGALATGFVKFGGKLYFFSSKDGKQRRTKGWFYHGSAMYYVKSDGTIATNTTIDGYKIGANGAVTDVNGMDKKAQGYSSSTRYLILVNKGKHLVNIYTGSKGSWSAVKRMFPARQANTPHPALPEVSVLTTRAIKALTAIRISRLPQPSTQPESQQETISTRFSTGLAAEIPTHTAPKMRHWERAALTAASVCLLI